MRRTHRVVTTCLLSACLVAGQFGVQLFASDDQSAGTPNLQLVNRSLLTLTQPAPPPEAKSLVAPIPLSAAGPVFAQRYYRGGWNHAPRTELIVGALASIAGGATLVYANRPDCSANPTAGGCGYGTKVIGGSVLAGGVLSMLLGALTWR